MLPDTDPRVRREVDDPEQSLAVAVTLAVAEARDVRPTALDPLDSAVPSEALTNLYEGAETDMAVTFEYEDRPVSVVDEGVVYVYPADVSLTE